MTQRLLLDGPDLTETVDAVVFNAVNLIMDGREVKVVPYLAVSFVLLLWCTAASPAQGQAPPASRDLFLIAMNFCIVYIICCS